MNKPILETRNLTRSFGAFVAVNRVSLEFAAGRIHALIGPNGAGKTTFLNLLSGDLEPSGGSVWFGGEDITTASSDRISRLGIGRSYQHTNVFPTLDIADNMWLAAQSRLPSSMRFFRPAASYTDVRDRARRSLDLVGLGKPTDIVAGALSHGERRQLELAMMLATEPELLLLDEPLAGLGPEESERVVELLASLARNHTMILVEHDIDAVFAIADDLTVMVNGRVLESGTPDSIRASPAVQEAYLGASEDLR